MRPDEVKEEEELVPTGEAVDEAAESAAPIEEDPPAGEGAPDAEKSAKVLFFEYPTFTGTKTVQGYYTPESDEEYNRLAPHADKAPA